jgi:hypothetical protein
MRQLLAALNTWSVLVGLGVLPTAAAVAAVIAGYLTADPVPFLALALCISIAGNVLLAIAALSVHRRHTAARRVVDHLERVRRRYDAQLPDRWLPGPGDLARLQFGQVEIEEAYTRALDKAREQISVDVELGLGHIGLLPVVIAFFNGQSHNADRHFVAAVDSDEVGLQGITRGLGQIEEPRTPWRTDDGWIQLIRESWAREQPFRGSVSLSAAHPYDFDSEAEQIRGGWIITYNPQDGGVEAPARKYALFNGAVTRLG